MKQKCSLQEIMPVVVEEEPYPGVPQEICLGQLLSMTALQHLSLTRDAASIFGDALAFLNEMRFLTELEFSDDRSGPDGWPADNPESWSLALQPLTALQACPAPVSEQ